MTAILNALNKRLRLLKHGDDDFYDRLSSRYSVGICLALALTVMAGQFAGEPIVCMTPAEFHDQWTKYADRSCWLSNTYNVPWIQSTSDSSEMPMHHEIPYYQWTPFILLLQACMFSLPRIVWSFSTHYVGYSVNRIVSLCNAPEAINPESRNKVVTFLTNQIDRLLGHRREFCQDILLANAKTSEQRKNTLLYGKRFGSYLVWIYLIVKLMFIGNALSQLLLMNRFIGREFTHYGWDVIQAALRGEKYDKSTIFPRETICTYSVRRRGGTMQEYSIQCVLPLNWYNEKIYIFLWWWMVFIVVASSIGVLAWLPSLIASANKRFVCTYLKAMGRSDPKEKQDRRDFVIRYLCLDGVFVMRLLADNVTDLVTGEVVASLYDNFVALRAKDN